VTRGWSAQFPTSSEVEGVAAVVVVTAAEVVVEATVVVDVVATVVVVVAGWVTEVVVDPAGSPGLHAATSRRVATRGLLMPSS
jgi:hypothetical protein